MYPENSHIRYKYEEITFNDRNSLAELQEDRVVRERFWHIESNDVCIDVGAGFGSYTLPALARGGFVHAFESNPNVMAFLRRNLAMNPQIFALEKCSTRLWRMNSGPLSIDKYIEGLSRMPDTVDWLKIDTGDRAVNVNVLQGARATIKRYRPNIVLNGSKEDMLWVTENGPIIYTEINGHGLAVFEKPSGP